MMELSFNTLLPPSGNRGGRDQQWFRDDLRAQLRATGLVGQRAFMGRLAVRLEVHDRESSPIDLDNVAKSMLDAFKIIGLTGDDRDVVDLHIVRCSPPHIPYPLYVRVLITLLRKHKPKKAINWQPLRATLGELAAVHA